MTKKAIDLLNPGHVLTAFCNSIQDHMIETNQETIDVNVLHTLFLAEVKKIAAQLQEYQTNETQEKLLFEIFKILNSNTNG